MKHIDWPPWVNSSRPTFVKIYMLLSPYGETSSTNRIILDNNYCQLIKINWKCTLRTVHAMYLSISRDTAADYKPPCIRGRPSATSPTASRLVYKLRGRCEIRQPLGCCRPTEWQQGEVSCSGVFTDHLRAETLHQQPHTGTLLLRDRWPVLQHRRAIGPRRGRRLTSDVVVRRTDARTKVGHTDTHVTYTCNAKYVSRLLR